MKIVISSLCKMLKGFKAITPALNYLMTKVSDSIIRNKKVNLATVVEGDKKAPFSIATTPKCREGRYSFPWIAPLYPWYVPYIAEC